ncbi:FkbM family methyltransferase [Candidatus Shapirobacteria bacterium]|nr:FkbM family methyltransferase [Candidatus Shapirobacteria bacterium]
MYRKLFFELLRQSHSQYGEDLIISEILKTKDIFYVDIGANHPKKFNNTYFFYRHGSHGINIEPNPYLLQQYSTVRSGDTNLNIGISSKPSVMKFYQMYPDVNSTFSKSKYLHNLQHNSLLVDTPSIEVTTLSLLFDSYLPQRQTIDLLSIDTEGHDLTVLKSNNWQKYCPRLICVETQSDHSLHSYLLKLGYKQVHKTPINSLYVQKSYSLFSLPTSL